MANHPAPPVDRSLAARPQARDNALTKYGQVVDTLKSNSADVRAIRSMLGSRELMDRFLAVVFTSLQGNTDLLLNASAASILQAVKDAAELGLDPTGLSGEAAIVRYGGDARLLPMWRGYVKRVYQSGHVAAIDCQIVYGADEFDIRFGTDPGIRHVPFIAELDEHGKPLEERGNYRGVYAWARLGTGERLIEWMTTADVEYVRERWSRANKPDSPWNTSWGEMARKTVVRRLVKRLPQSSTDLRLARMLELDARNDVLEATIAAARPTAETATARAAAIAATTARVRPGREAPGAPPPGLTDGTAAPAPEAALGPSEGLSEAVAPTATTVREDPPWPER